MNQKTNVIITRLEESKRIKINDDRFIIDIDSFLSSINCKNLKAVYNHILIYSIKCPSEKNLRSFEIDIPKFSNILSEESILIARKINRNCKNDVYKFSILQ